MDDWYRNANWLSPKRLREWQGITNDEAGRADRLYLTANNLSGELPGELGQLAAAKILSMSANNLTGRIPPELGGLSNLRWIFLRWNHLTGEIPPELGGLSSLEWLYLSSNQLTGEIPAELGSLSRLERLVLSSNQLTGNIPPDLGNLSSLKWLILNSNQLTGEIPPELDKIPDLQALRLSGNEWTGCIPEGLRDVPDNDLGQLGLAFCDVLLSSLVVSPGGLTQAFDPHQAEYTVAVGRSRVTVLPANEHNASFEFFGAARRAGALELTVLQDADDTTPGFQVDFSHMVPALKIKVTSEDGQTNYTYTITDLGIRYDVNKDDSIDRDEVIEAIKDYFADRITRDEVIAVIKLYFTR